VRDAEMLLDRGDAVEQMIDLFGEAGLALDEPLQGIELPVNNCDLLSEIGKAVIDISQSGSNSVEATFDAIEALMYPLEFVQYDATKSLEVGFSHSWKYIMIKMRAHDFGTRSHTLMTQ
jgi:hypothetical protein